MACFTSRSVIEEQRKAFMCCNVTQMPAGGVGAEGAAAQRKKRDEEEKHNKINWIFFSCSIQAADWLHELQEERSALMLCILGSRPYVCLPRWGVQAAIDDEPKRVCCAFRVRDHSRRKTQNTLVSVTAWSAMWSFLNCSKLALR